MIPKKIFQTQKSLKFVINNKRLSKAMKSWAKWGLNGSGYEYFFYDDQMCDLFMAEKFPDLYEYYKELPIPVMKADVWRYCIIYKYGGIYADMDTVLLKYPDLFLKDSLFVGVPENKIHMCQWVFAAPPESPLLGRVIDEILERLKRATTADLLNKHFIHELTGPAIFTKGIKGWLSDNTNFTIYKKGETDKFSEYKNNKIWIYNIDCHFTTVKHLYSSGWEGGWLQDREKFHKSLLDRS